MGIRTDRLKYLRESRHWTQQDLAEKCGIGSLQIHRYETGISDPPLDKLKSLAGLFGVTSDYLLGLVDSAAPYGLPQDQALTGEELVILETFRRDGWLGVARLSVDKIPG